MLLQLSAPYRAGENWKPQFAKINAGDFEVIQLGYGKP